MEEVFSASPKRQGLRKKMKLQPDEQQVHNEQISLLDVLSHAFRGFVFFLVLSSRFFGCWHSRCPSSDDRGNNNNNNGIVKKKSMLGGLARHATIGVHSASLTPTIVFPP